MIATLLLCIIFFFSGMSALVFEFLWFRLAGLMFGNSVWAASIVLGSFMGGLALGNWISIFMADKIKRHLLVYVFLEIIIASSGFFLIVFLPQLTKLFVPLFQPFLDTPLFLNFIRSLIAFCLLLIPTTAMGATLPVLVKTMNSQLNNFGRTLGLLYGCNTLGGVVGVLWAEVFLVRQLGLTASGAIAASLNIVAGVLAYTVYLNYKNTSQPTYDVSSEDTVKTTISSKAKRLTLLSFFTGFIFLALEVIWFRFLLLFVDGYSLNFSIMLAIVLVGISLGGFAASQWYKKNSQAHRYFNILLYANGVLIVSLYLSFFRVVNYVKFDNPSSATFQVVVESIFLIFPVSIISGVMFTMIGKILNEEVPQETKAAGILTLANTVGAMLGSLFSGLVFIPFLGIENSFFLMALLYGLLVFLLKDDQRKVSAQGKLVIRFAALLFVLIMILFPFGKMEKYLDIPVASYLKEGERRVAFKEGVNETIQYLRTDFLGEPLNFRLVTNGHSMSGTNIIARRYMRMFIYLPLITHPDLKKAALICFGTGTTAKVLTDSKSLEQIDIIDISKNVIGLSDVVFPDENENPVNDPRVTIHIEDGRFFLQTRTEKYDLISGEPPPLKYRGVVNLYSKEYFQLIYDRLNEGGMTTYWLPIHQIDIPSTQSILKAFCDVFNNCSLWSGSPNNWMLAGIKGKGKPVTEKQFAALWNDPATKEELQTVGFESPEVFSSFFIADDKMIKNWVKGSLPLVDNYFYRLNPDREASLFDKEKYMEFYNLKDTVKSFSTSPWIAEMVPESLRKKAMKYFSLSHSYADIRTETSQTTWDKFKTFDKLLKNPLYTDFYLLRLFYSDNKKQQIGHARNQHHGLQPDDIVNNLEQKTLDALSENKIGLARELMDMGEQLGLKMILENNFSQAEKIYKSLSHLTTPRQQEDFYYMRMYLLFQLNDFQGSSKVQEEYLKILNENPDKEKERMISQLAYFWLWLNK